MSRNAAARGARPGRQPRRDRPVALHLKAEEEFRSVYDAAGVAMARLTQRGRIIDVNQSFGKLLGRPAGELAGHRFVDLLHPDDRAALRAGHISTLKAGMVLAEVRLKAGQGVVWGKATISLARRSDDAPDSLILTVEDISALKSREGALERERLHDRATGLANADLLSFRLTRSIAASRRVRGRLAVLVLEIDRFEEIEAEQGPGSAEKLLAYLGERLQQYVRPADSVARTGGNELAVVLATINDAEVAAGVGRRLMAHMEPEFHLGDSGFQVKISMGVALFPRDGGTSEALLRQARIDMYLGNRGLPAEKAPADGTRPGASIAANTTGLGSGSPDLIPHATRAADGPAATCAAPAAVVAPLSSGAGAVAPSPPRPAAAAVTGPVESAPIAAEADPADAGEDLARRVEQLEPVSLFLALPDRVLRRIARYMSEQAVRAGEELAGPASPVALRIIQEGTCEVRHEQEGESLTLLTLGPGDFMGVDSLFSDDPLPVYLRALTECKLLVLEGDMVARAAPPGSAFREALRQAAGQRDSHLRALISRPRKLVTGVNATQVAVYSTKGGSGRTTIALNLGAELGRRHPGEVLVVDLALPYNHIALLGNLSPSTCLARIGQASDANFSALAWSAVLPHPAGFMALPATLRPEEAELVTPQLLLRAMNVLAPQFRYIIFDTGVALDDNVLATLEMSDHLVLVATPELASMHDTRQVIDLATRILHIPAGRVHTILNHRSPDSLLSRKVVEDVLGCELTAEFRYFGVGPEMAGLEGKLQVQSDPGGHFSRSVRAILDRVIEPSVKKTRSA